MVRAPVDESTTSAVRRRPRDRRQRIVAAAAQQFAEVGFHDVSMASIADAVGIGASALYRHFEDKQRLLRAAVMDAFERFNEAMTDVDDAETLLRRTILSTIEYRELSTLWQRELRHLAPDDQALCRQWMRDSHARLVAALAVEHPDMSQEELDVRTWAIQSAHTSLGRHHVRLETGELAELLYAVADSLRHADIDQPADTGAPPPPPPVTPPAGALAPASRREALLAAAVELIGQNGYRAVSLDEIGAAAGIAGPSIYNHFPNKAAILVAAFRRATEALLLALQQVFRTSVSAEDALDRLLRTYTRMALDNTALFSLLVTEVVHLPPEDRDELRRMQQDYLTEWVTLLRTVRPELGEDVARVLVQASLGLVIDLSRTPHLRSRPWLAEELVALGRAVLRTPFPG